MQRDHEDVREPEGPELPWDGEWSPREIVELFEPMVVEARRARIAAVVDGRLDSVTVVLDAPHDPHNGAAVVRSCDAFGVRRLHAVARSEPFLLARGVTTGADRWVDVIVHSTARAAVDALHGRGYRLVSTHPAGRLLPRDLSGLQRVALVLGNEHDGISAELAAAADDSVRIPMRGFVESLNVSVSAAILLAAATEGRPGDLTAEQKEAAYARALFRSVQRAGEILVAARDRRR